MDHSDAIETPIEPLSATEGSTMKPDESVSEVVNEVASATVASTTVRPEPFFVCFSANLKGK